MPERDVQGDSPSRKITVACLVASLSELSTSQGPGSYFPGVLRRWACKVLGTVTGPPSS